MIDTTSTCVIRRDRKRREVRVAVPFMLAMVLFGLDYLFAFLFKKFSTELILIGWCVMLFGLVNWLYPQGIERFSYSFNEFSKTLQFFLLTGFFLVALGLSEVYCLWVHGSHLF